MSLSRFATSTNFKIVVCVILLCGAVIYGRHRLQTGPYTVQQLIDAVKAEDVPLVKKILTETPYLNFQDSKLLPPSLALNKAIKTRNLEILFLLLDHGFEVNCPHKTTVTRDMEDYTCTCTTVTERPLDVAIRTGDIPIVKLLIRRGAKIQKCDNLLFNAVCSQNVEMVRYLIDIGVDYHAAQEKSTLNEDILWNALPNKEIVQCLLEHGYQWQHGYFVISDDQYEAPRLKPGEHLIHNTNSLRVIDSLLQAGVDIDTRDSEGRTALHHAVILGHSGLDTSQDDNTDYEELNALDYRLLVLYLIDHGANPRILDYAGKTPADYASDSFKREYDRLQWIKNAYGWDSLYHLVFPFNECYIGNATSCYIGNASPDKQKKEEPCPLTLFPEPPKDD